ncbi:hypothetical protein F511_10556 [Dorcoceras hygrometricum]|uniref:Uncharacterized protein n=1 Tax=Dorcoceras hygrometricum TaxID=472368 RepID=A0A2Z7BH12_9LAMI|nr:hypothetical protein F511_10556 [Dorcoceras hygrometricum]
MCSGGTVDNQLGEAFCVQSIPVAEYTSHRIYRNVYQSRIYQSQCIPVAYIPVAVVPPQTVEATTIAPVEQLSVPKRKSQKRKRKLVLEDATVVQKSVDEMVERVDAPVPASVEQPAVVPVVEGTTDDPDTVINEVLNLLDSISGDKDDKQSDRSETWFERAFDEMLRNYSPVVTHSDTDEEEETIEVGAAGVDQQKARIPFNASLPSTLAPTITPIRFGQRIEFRKVDAYKASLPKIDSSYKGKGILVEDDVHVRVDAQLAKSWRAPLSLSRPTTVRRPRCRLAPPSAASCCDRTCYDQLFDKFPSVPNSSGLLVQADEGIVFPVVDLIRRSTAAYLLKCRFPYETGRSQAPRRQQVLLRHMREHQLEWTRPSSSSLFEGPVIDRGFFIHPTHHSITSKCWIRAKIMVDGSWIILEGVDYWRPINTPVNSRHLEALPQRPYLDDLVRVDAQLANLWEHCDVLSMQIDSDLVIYRTTLVRTFQVVTICRVDKSESTISVLGKLVYLVTLAMSLFDLQDVCIVIGSLATLDLPMVVDLIGIYVLKGPYCTLTMTNWFLQALSVIPRGSWRDVARIFTMIRWASPNF